MNSKKKVSKVSFRGIDKDVLRKFCNDVCDYLVAQAARKQDELSKRIFEISQERPRAFAAIVLFSIVATITNIDRIPTTRLEGTTIDRKLLKDTIKEFSEKYIA